jgi:uncharacterized protein YdeI (YjbR/CyaY-like superfamily)
MHRTPEDLKKILENNKKVLGLWKKLTPLARNEWICYITIVKKIETRKKHLERLYTDLCKGKKRPCCWPGCPHRQIKKQKMV